MPHLGYLAGFVLIVLSVTYGRAILRVLSVRLRTQLSAERVEPGEVPDDLRALLEAESRALLELGFEPVAYVRTSCPLDGVDQPSWSRLLQHPRELSFAWLVVSGSSRTRPCEVVFHAQADEGRRVETVGWAITDEHPDCAKHVVIDARTVSLAEQWQRHQSEVVARPDFAPRDVSADELLVEQRGVAKCALRTSVERGRLAPVGENVARYTLRHAIATVVASTRRDARRRAAIALHDKGLAPTDVTAEVWAHRRRDGAERSRRSGWVMKLGLFAVSVGAAALAFGLELSLETVAILFGVLFVHELGHALAMKAFGYRNLQILFIPFLGAVASGSKRDVAPWQEIVVLLAGPVPGIVAGTALLCVVTQDSSPPLYSVAWAMLIVNYANLLPIMPLDGGRILNVALFDRFPNLQLGFAALSGAALLGLGSALDETVLRVIGIVMLVGLPAQWRHGRLLAGARARLSQLAPEPAAADPVPALYTELRQPRFDSLNAESRYQLVAQLAERLLRRPASAGLALVSVVGWLVVMVLPLGLIQYRAVPAVEQALADAQADHERRAAEWGAKIASAATPHDEVRLRLAAAQASFARFDHEEASRQLEPALARLRALGDPELAASVLLLRARLELAPAEAARFLNRALDLREQHFGPESLEVAEVLDAFPDGGPSDRVAALVRALRLTAIYERELGALPDGHRLLVQAHASEARLRDAGGDHARAEAALLNAQAVAEAAPQDARHQLQFEVAYELSGFYFGRDRRDEAGVQLDRLAELGAEPGSVDRCWLAYWAGDPEASGRCFAAARAELPKGAAGQAAAVEFALDQAAAASRAGDEPEALRLLAFARKSVAEFQEPLELWVASEDDVPASAGFAALETHRRRVERARVLEPLLASAR